MLDPERKAQLERAYRATDYIALGDRQIVIRIDERSEELDELLMREGVDGWAFITACNPDSRPLTEALNQARQAQLHELLVQQGVRFHSGVGQGHHSNWTPEPSFLILGIDEAAARELARQFGQLAFVHGRQGGRALLAWPEES